MDCGFEHPSEVRGFRGRFIDRLPALANSASDCNLRTAPDKNIPHLKLCPDLACHNWRCSTNASLRRGQAVGADAPTFPLASCSQLSETCAPIPPARCLHAFVPAWSRFRKRQEHPKIPKDPSVSRRIQKNRKSPRTPLGRKAILGTDVLCQDRVVWDVGMLSVRGRAAARHSPKRQ